MAKKKFLWCTVFMIVLVACLSLAACVDNQEPSESQTGSEVGEYYYETESGEEYLLSLNEDGSVSFSSDTELSGSYTISDETLTLTFGQDGEDDLVINASYENGTVTLTYEGTEMQFLEKMYYTVTFETNGGTAIDSVQVLNGKTVAEPEKEPSRTNYEFLGWYKDSACSEPFDFTMEKITANTTVYAKWEYTNTITYDFESSGLNENVSVSEGEPYTLSVPETEYGYVFLGWFTENGDKLTDGTGKSLAAWDPSEYGNITVYARFEVDLEYTLTSDGSGYSAAGKTTSAELENLIIPDTHEGKPIVEVLNFNDYTKLKTVSMPNTVNKELGNAIFDESVLLESFEIRDSGAENPRYTSQNGVIFSADMTMLVRYPVAKSGDGDTTTYTVPVSVTEIAAYAFQDIAEEGYSGIVAGTLTKIVLSQGLEYIGDYAFHMRGKLTSVEFYNNESLVEWSIGDFALYGVALQSFDFNDNLTSIGNSAFAAHYPNGLQVTEIRFTENSKLESIGDSAFQDVSGLQTIVLPPLLTYLGNSAFLRCSVSTVEFLEESKLEEIGNQTFKFCSVSTIQIPDSVTSIGESAFQNCSRLTWVEFSEGLESIGESAFANCSRLTSIKMPNSLRTIGSSAFSTCYDLKSVILNEGLKEIGANAFKNSSGGIAVYGELIINIPSTVTSAGDNIVSDSVPTQKMTIDSQTFLARLADDSCLSYIDMLVIRDGLTVPDSIKEDFTEIETKDGYITYINREIKIISQEFLDDVVKQDWFYDIDAIYINSNLFVPAEITAAYTKTKNSVGSYPTYDIYVKNGQEAD